MLFLTRMKDKVTFSLCIKFPDHIEGGKCQMILLEKDPETHGWNADKKPVMEAGEEDEEGNVEEKQCKTLGPTVKQVMLLTLALHEQTVAEPVPKPE